MERLPESKTLIPRQVCYETVDLNGKNEVVTRVKSSYTHLLAMRGSVEEMADAIRIDPECVFRTYGRLNETTLHTAAATEFRHEWCDSCSTARQT
jgi:hypothetical protein